MVWAQGCQLRLLDTLTGVDQAIGGTCGSFVTPGTVNTSSMVFEGRVNDVAIDSLGRWYVLDEKYLWRSNANQTQFSVVVGAQFDSGITTDGTDGRDFFLSSPRSLAIYGNVFVVGEGSRLEKFDYEQATDRFSSYVLIKDIPTPGNAATVLAVSQTTVNDVRAVEFLDQDEVLFAEHERHIVRHINLTTNLVSPVVGSSYQHEGPYVDANNAPVASASALLGYPLDITVGNNGIYIRKATQV